MSFFNMTLLIRLIASLACSIAFAVIFKVAPRHLILGGICGTLTYFIYYTVEFFGASPFVAALVSTMFTALYSEVASRLRHAPTIVFLIPGIIPTVPGGALYNAVRYLLMDDLTLAYKYLSDTVGVGLGIAGGIITISILFGSALDIRSKFSSLKKPKI